MTITTTSTDTARAELAALLPGQVLLPGDAGWEAGRLGWTVSAAQEPWAVVTVEEEEDVATTVRFAAERGLTVSAQPVGHGATTAATGTILLRTRPLRGIIVDPERRTARVGAGVKWGELLAAVAPHGLTGLAGSSPDPTVVGFSVSGGLSWFGRAYGLAAHALRAVELVDPSGQHRRITAENDPELFWAVRGGGGEFGIITAVEIALFPAPHVYGGRIMWPLEMARPVLRAYRDVTRSAPDELTTWAHILRFPPIPEVPEPLRGRSFVSVEATFLGSSEDAEELLAPLRTLPAVVFDSMGTVPLERLGDILQEPLDPMPTQEVSWLLEDLDVATIDRLVDVAGAGVQTPVLLVQLRHLGGALSRGSVEDGPNGAVPEQYQVFCLGVPVSPEVVAGIAATSAQVTEAVAPVATGRTFFTFLGAETDPSRAFTPRSLERLRDVKRAVDPRGTVRGNRPLLPAALPAQREA
ncbi:FAD/FMN-containing dehydrogenase [Motilibacter rhizosphaerae]|uniref:FAD/FMN-containing dehydrogenase n=1 Tax=Motilibacter rhizosphaerae TaxID=598652 RepID=A0A4Q7NA07_9ACTN|nr:FAD-binding oxidoreductase [Motilibacter rhizosphaerae]RZS79005.1 FAD/FMN-containing dehydrogenase [Motilibacter rhizosphaerae]